MRQKVSTQPDLSLTSPAHLEAKKAKKQDAAEFYRRWERNVSDRFKDKSEEDIKADLQRSAWPFAVCFEHWTGDFNIGSGIRNANAFNAQEVFYLGEKKWDKRSAVGVYNYTEVKWIPTIEELAKLQDKYTIVGIDNIPGRSVSMEYYSFPRDTLMVFGEEGTGLTSAMQAFCRDIVEIPMYGSVRSLNCGVASGIVMYEFVRQMKERTNAAERFARMER